MFSTAQSCKWSLSKDNICDEHSKEDWCGETGKRKVMLLVGYCASTDWWHVGQHDDESDLRLVYISVSYENKRSICRIASDCIASCTDYDIVQL